MVAQVCGVIRALVSVSKITPAGHRVVVFEKDNWQIGGILIGPKMLIGPTAFIGPTLGILAGPINYMNWAHASTILNGPRPS